MTRWMQSMGSRRSIDAIIVTPVMLESQLKHLLREWGIHTADVVSTLSPMSELSDFWRGNCSPDGLGAMLEEAILFATVAHSPQRIVLVSDEDDFAERTAMCAAHLREKIRQEQLVCDVEYRCVTTSINWACVLGLTCIDWRLGCVLDTVDPEQTAWLRLPGIDGTLASGGPHAAAILREVRHLVSLTMRHASVRIDPHADCLARSVRNGLLVLGDQERHVQDAHVMREDHLKALQILASTGITMKNETGVPARRFVETNPHGFQLLDY